MVALPQPVDPTLVAVDRALEAKARAELPRRYLGMSSVGQECTRATWYGFRWVTKPEYDAPTLKRFADGHLGEDVQAERLRMVEDLQLWTVDPETGEGQIAVADFGDPGKEHFRGHCDGVLLGLLQAPKTPHVWEHKQVGERAFRALENAKNKFGEKDALRAWNLTYFGQGQGYMHYLQITRHYMTVSTPGGRNTTSVRTNYDAAYAINLVEQARRIVFAQNPPARLSEDPAFFKCKWCDHNTVCHGLEFPQLRNCRTCLHSTPLEAGGWHCARHDIELSDDAQREGCSCHLFIPSLVPAEQFDAGDDWVAYRLPNGTDWRDGPQMEAVQNAT